MRNLDELKEAWANTVNEFGAEHVLDHLALSTDEWKILGVFFMENCLDVDEHSHRLFDVMIGHEATTDG